jgi:hypothetical protein
MDKLDNQKIICNFEQEIIASHTNDKGSKNESQKFGTKS